MNNDPFDPHDTPMLRIEPNLNPHLADELDDFGFAHAIVNAVIFLAVIGAIGAVVLSVVLP